MANPFLLCSIREAVLDVPYTFSHCLGASLVLFNE